MDFKDSPSSPLCTRQSSSGRLFPEALRNEMYHIKSRVRLFRKTEHDDIIPEKSVDRIPFFCEQLLFHHHLRLVIADIGGKILLRSKLIDGSLRVDESTELEWDIRFIVEVEYLQIPERILLDDEILSERQGIEALLSHDVSIVEECPCRLEDAGNPNPGDSEEAWDLRADSSDEPFPDHHLRLLGSEDHSAESEIRDSRSEWEILRHAGSIEHDLREVSRIESDLDPCAGKIIVYSALRNDGERRSGSGSDAVIEPGEAVEYQEEERSHEQRCDLREDVRPFGMESSQKQGITDHRY